MPSSSQRKAIRTAAQAALLNATAAADRVVTTRRLPWRTTQLPGIGVYTLEEDVDPESHATAPRELKRHPKLAIEAVLRVDDSNIDDALDDIAMAIEIAIAKDDTLGGTASDCWLMRTEFDFGNQGDQEVAIARLIFYVTYFQYAPSADDATFDDLKTVDTTYDLEAGAQNAANRAEDDVTKLDQ